MQPNQYPPPPPGQPAQQQAPVAQYGPYAGQQMPMTGHVMQQQAAPPVPGAPDYQQQASAYLHQQTQQPPQEAAQEAPSLNLIDPSGGQGGGDWAPNVRHLMGGEYAVLILPRSFDPNNQGPGGGVKPQITYDFVIVNVGRNGETLPPVEFGDNQSRNYSEQRPNCFRLTGFPAEFSGARSTNQEIVKELAPHVGSGALVAARVVQGTQGNRPPLLQKLDPNDPARAALVQAWTQRLAQPGSLRREVGNGLEHINGGPPVKQNAQQGYATGPTQGMPPAPGGYGAPQQQSYGPPPGAQVNYAAPPPPPPPGAYPPPPGAPAGPPPAALAQGWTAEQWAVAPAHVKQAYGA
jgi:hypothetical protein